jgi:hypothetical protein
MCTRVCQDADHIFRAIRMAKRAAHTARKLPIEEAERVRAFAKEQRIRLNQDLRDLAGRCM